MGLRDEIEAELLPELAGELSDATKPFVGNRVSGGGWDDDLNEPIPETVVSYSGTFIMGKFTEQEHTMLNVKQGDIKVMLMARLLNGVSEPLLTDTIILNGQQFHIKDIAKITTDIAWNLQLRAI